MGDDKRVAIVTGAGSGIGRAIAHVLAEEKLHVVAVGRSIDKLRQTADSSPAAGVLEIHAADVSAPDQTERLIAEVLAKHGRIDVLVNNAGVNTKRRELTELSTEDWDRLLRINLTGAFLMIRAVLPTMRRQQAGLIVNISSLAGLRASTLSGAAYAASKFGLNALSGVVTLEEARQGIRSSVICPGEVDTPILEQRPEPVSPERRAKILQPTDVAEAVRFIVRLPPRAHVPELVIKPTTQPFA
jgi:NADP-dependent 3-hydroxy acid dehydrogenase YdfG